MDDNLINGQLKKIEDVVESILNNDEICIKFIQKKDRFFEGIELEYIYSFFQRFSIKQNDEKRKKRLDIVHERVKWVNNDSYQQLDKEQVLDLKIEEAIIKDIDFNAIPEDITLALYNSLNRNVSFDSDFFILKQDLDNTIAREKYNKKINDVSEKDNRLVCRGWADAFAFLINKYVGGTVYIKISGRHRDVVACVGKSIIFADATNNTYSKKDGTSLPDLVRAKLGLMPSGFKILYSLENIEISKLPTYKKSRYYDVENDYFSDRPSEEEITELRNLIDESLNTNDRGALSAKDEIEIIMKKVVFINKLLRKSALKESKECISYLKQICVTLFQDEKGRVELIHRLFYRKRAEDDSLEYVPILSVYLGRMAESYSKRKDKDYIFFTFHEGDYQFKIIKKEDIIKLVSSSSIIQIYEPKYYNYQNMDFKLEKMGLPELKKLRIGEIIDDYRR